MRSTNDNVFCAKPPARAGADASKRAPTAANGLGPKRGRARGQRADRASAHVSDSPATAPGGFPPPGYRSPQQARVEVGSRKPGAVNRKLQAVTGRGQHGRTPDAATSESLPSARSAACASVRAVCDRRSGERPRGGRQPDRGTARAELDMNDNVSQAGFPPPPGGYGIARGFPKAPRPESGMSGGKTGLAGYGSVLQHKATAMLSQPTGPGHFVPPSRTGKRCFALRDASGVRSSVQGGNGGSPVYGLAVRL